MPNDKSFQLIRTNPALTSNIKVVVNDKYKLFLESFNTNKQLNDSRYKHYAMSEDQYYDTIVASFWNRLSKGIVFDVKDSGKKDIMYTDYNTQVNQFDPIYYAGASNIEDQWHDNEFEYLAPLYIKPNHLPEGFIILRVDEPAIFNPRENYRLDTLSRENFREQIIDKWKAVSLFDMTDETELGQWINKNFVNNDLYPSKAFEFDDRSYSNPRWHGLNYLDGTWTQATSFFKETMEYAHPHFKLEEMINRGFQENYLIYPHIINFKFLFNDSPADPFRYNKYSINRYYGFYIDKLDWISNLTSYEPPKLKSGLQIVNNIFADENDFKNTVYPFEEKFDPQKSYYIYAKGELHEVKRNLEEGEYVYKIISDKEIKIEDINTEGIVNINHTSSERTFYENTIVGRYDNLEIDSYIDNNDEKKGLYGDLYVIEIDGKYHVLKHRDSEEYIEGQSGTIIFEWTGETNDVVGDDEWIYAATNEGIKVFDWSGNLIWQIEEAENTDLPSNQVNTLYLKNKMLYAGTSQGIWIKNFNNLAKTGNNIINSDNANIPCNNIHEIYFDTYLVIACNSGNSYIWWSDYSENGVIDNDNGKMSGWKDHPINSFSIDNENNLYVAEGNVIRKYYEFKKDSFLEFNSNSDFQIPDARINSIYIEDDGIYAGTDEGFWIKKGPFEKLYNSERYENLENDKIQDIQINTDQGLAYLATNSGNSNDGFYILNYFDNNIEKYTNNKYSDINTGITSIVAHEDGNKVAYGSINGTQIFNLPLDAATSFKRFEYYLNTDYGVISDENILQYWIGGEESNDFTLKDVINNGNVLQYPIYRLKFSDIKDFDFDRVNTGYADFDYLQNNKYTETDEPKLHAINYKDEYSPRDYRRYESGKYDGRIINVSSEYIADDELWEVKKPNNLSEIWRKNQYVCKWGVSNSISHSDYPYKLNNYVSRSNRISKYNRTTNVALERVDIREKNLDYMYRVGELLENSGGTAIHFLNQSSNIETNIMNPDSRKFNLDKYINSEFDYFSYFFDNFMKQRIDNSDENTKSTEKFSMFGHGEKYEASFTLFAGVYYRIYNINDIVYTLNEKGEYDVKEIKRKDGIENQYNDYKFSVIFNPAYDYQSLNCSKDDVNTGKIDNRLIKPLYWYNPIYLKGFDEYDKPLDPPVRGFNSGETNNVDLISNNFTGLTYWQGDVERVSPVWKNYSQGDEDENLSYKEDELLYMKRQGNLFLKVNYNISGKTLGFLEFSDIDLRGDFVIFSGDTYYDSEGYSGETTEEITQFYILENSSSQVGERFISLRKWNEEDFKNNYKDWISNNKLYRSDNKLRNEGIIDTQDTIKNEEKGIHIFLNDIYKNCLTIVNSYVLMREDYLSLNNTEKFDNKYGFYYGVTLTDDPIYKTGKTYSTVVNSGKTIVGDQCPELINDGEYVNSRNEIVNATLDGLWIYNQDFKQGELITDVEENEFIDNLLGLVNIEKVNDNEFYLLNRSGESFLYNISTNEVDNYNNSGLSMYYDSENENLYVDISGGTILINGIELTASTSGDELPDENLRGYAVDEKLNDVYLYGDWGIWKYDIDEDSGETFKSGTTEDDIPSNDIRSLVVNNGIFGVSFYGDDNNKIWINNNGEVSEYIYTDYENFDLYHIDENYLILRTDFFTGQKLSRINIEDGNIINTKKDINNILSFDLKNNMIYLYEEINNLKIYKYPSLDNLYEWNNNGNVECFNNDAIIERSFYNKIDNDYLLSLTGESSNNELPPELLSISKLFDNDLSTSESSSCADYIDNDLAFKIVNLNSYISEIVFKKVALDVEGEDPISVPISLIITGSTSVYEKSISIPPGDYNDYLIYIDDIVNDIDIIFNTHRIDITESNLYEEIEVHEIEFYTQPSPNQFIVEESGIYLFGKGLQKIQFGYGSENIYSPSNIVAKKYIDSINSVNKPISFDKPVTYHHIDEQGNYNKYEMEGNEKPPFLLQIFKPQIIETKKHSYDIQPLSGPNKNIKNFQKPGENPQSDDIVKRPLARLININKSSDSTNVKDKIYRYNANYEPIFKNIEVFNKSDYDLGEAMKVYPENYRFFDSFSKFGIVDEIMYSKVNENGSILKLKNSNGDKSIYPMVDEYGLDFTDRFIFKSNWDSQFYIRTIKKLRE